MKLLCVGDVMVETVVHVAADVGDGDEAQGVFETRVGGQALNVARVFHRLGGQSLFYAAVGQDEWAGWLRRQLRQEGLKFRFQKTAKPTGMVISIASPQDRTMYAQRGANEMLDLSQLKKFKLKNEDGLYFSGYLMNNPQGITQLQRAIENHNRNLTVIDTPPVGVMNKVGVDRFLQACAGIQVFLTNQDEAAVLTRKSNLKEMLELLANRFPMVIIKQGAKGCSLADQSEVVHVPTTPLKNINATGAGDAFCGGFLYALSQGQSSRAAAQFAHEVAAKVISREA